MMNTADVRPRAYFTQWFLGSDGSRTPLCSYHVRKRSMLGDAEYQPEAEKPVASDCDQACVDCVERERTQGDAYNLGLGDHHESIAVNCDVICYAMEDILSTLEICLDKTATDQQAEEMRGWQTKIRGVVDFFDTGLNEKYSLAAKLGDMIDDIEGNADDDY